MKTTRRRRRGVPRIPTPQPAPPVVADTGGLPDLKAASGAPDRDWRLYPNKRTPPLDITEDRTPAQLAADGDLAGNVPRETFAGPLPQPDPMFTREAAAMATLKAMGVEQGHAPPTVLHNGLLIANLPRGPYRPLRSYEIIELLRVQKEWARPLSAEEVVTLLGLSEKVR